MDNNRDFKIYVLLFWSVVLYFILIAIKNIPLHIFNIGYNIEIYDIIYQIVAIGITIFFFASKIRYSYDKIIDLVRNYLTGLGAILVYLILSELHLLPFQLLNIDYNKIPLYLKIIYSLCYEAILIGIIILIHLKKLKKDVDDIKKNHNKYYKNCLKYWLISLFIMYISNLCIYLMGSGLPNNEEIIREQFQISPIYIFISAVVFAPLLEELVFRQSFHNLFENKWLFIIISGLVFGGMHVFSTDITSIYDILYIIPYSAPGMAFAYMLEKTDNIFVSMGFHMLHNGIMLSLQFLSFYFL